MDTHLKESTDEYADATEGVSPASSRIRLWWRWIVINRIITRILVMTIIIYASITLSSKIMNSSTGKWEKIVNAFDPLPSPVDPSIYSEIYPETPDPKLKEIAETMTELYELFVKMGYLPAEKLHYPPHEGKRIDTKELARWGFTKEVVDLLQMMPYVDDGAPDSSWNFGSDAGEFLFGGEFYDVRGEDQDFAHSLIDPTYALGAECPYWDEPDKDMDCPTSWHEENGYYIRPYYLVLNDCGNHGTVMIVNTKDYKIWVIDQLGGSTDPVFEGIPAPKKEPKNRNDLNQYPNRPAVEFLRDMINRFTTLEYIPGGLYNDHWPEYTSYKNLYSSSGWPGNFDLKAFTLGREKLEELDRQRWTDEEPLRNLESLQRALDQSRQRTEEIRKYENMLKPVDLSPEQRTETEDRLERLRGRHRTEDFKKMKERERERLGDIEMALAKEEDGDEKRRLQKTREGLLAGLEDADYISRERRLLEEAKKEAEKVDPEVRKKYKEWVEKYGS